MATALITFCDRILYGLKCVAVMVLLLQIWPSFGQDVDLPDLVMDPAEVEAIYRVLEGVNHDIDWRSMFPGNPCTDGPHGIICDTDNNTWHVVELNLGWVSDYVNNPPCSDNATIDPAIFQFSHLKKLFFYNCFTKMLRTIPSEIWKLASLQHLTFQSNSALVGEIPPEIGNLTHLERLVLLENSLSGFIPAEIGNLKNLQQLVLYRNEFIGLIPDTFQNLDSLKILDLSGNQLSGEIPHILERLTSLLKLDLSDNFLSGGIPYELGNLENLQLLDLSSNRLNGSIPDSLHKLSSMQYLLLGENLLGGPLPEFWGNLSNLIGLKLSDSSYKGRIPDSLGLLHLLNLLDLDNNQLVGSIPSSLGDLPSLYHMNLSSNLLSGPILFPLSFMNRLGKNLHFHNNLGLCYRLPLINVSSMEIAQCSSQRNSTLNGSSQTQQPSFAMNNSYASSSKRKPKSMVLLCSAILYCFSMLQPMIP